MSLSFANDQTTEDLAGEHFGVGGGDTIEEDNKLFRGNAMDRAG